MVKNLRCLNIYFLDFYSPLCSGGLLPPCPDRLPKAMVWSAGALPAPLLALPGPSRSQDPPRTLWLEVPGLPNPRSEEGAGQGLCQHPRGGHRGPANGPAVVLLPGGARGGHEAGAAPWWEEGL